MKEINDLFKQMTEEELIQAVTEIEESETTGAIKEDGIIRKYLQLSCDMLGDTSIQLFTTIINIMATATFRWKPKI